MAVKIVARIREAESRAAEIVARAGEEAAAAVRQAGAGAAEHLREESLKGVQESATLVRQVEETTEREVEEMLREAESANRAIDEKAAVGRKAAVAYVLDEVLRRYGRS